MNVWAPTVVGVGATPLLAAWRGVPPLALVWVLGARTKAEEVVGAVVAAADEADEARWRGGWGPVWLLRKCGWWCSGPTESLRERGRFEPIDGSRVLTPVAPMGEGTASSLGYSGAAMAGTGVCIWLEDAALFATTHEKHTPQQAMRTTRKRKRPGG